MKRVILDSIAGFNWIKRDVFTPGAVIRVLGDDDVARVGNIVILTSLSMGAGERDLILEVTPAPVKEVAPATDDEDTTDDADTTDAPSDEEEEGEG